MCAAFSEGEKQRTYVLNRRQTMKKKKKKVTYGRYGYIFIAPFFITYLLFQFWPLINTFYYSTLSYYKRNGREIVSFAGIQNFLNVLGLSAGERPYALK